jgi:predicted heme/steroid binding protein
LSTPTLNDMLIGTDVENLNETKNFLIGDIAEFILADNYVPYVGANKNVDLGLFSITASSFIVPGGLPTQFVKADGTLDSTVYQPAGNYITGLSGEATASGPGVATVVLNNGAVIGKVLTGLTITGGSVSSTDTILQAFGKLQNQVNGLYGGAIYQGTWNAASNTPTLQSGVGTKGYYYIVNVAGSTNLDGITDWNVGDWAIFDGTAWQQVDNTDTVVSVNGKVGVVVLTTTDIAEGDNLYYTDERVWEALSLTTIGNSGAATYDNQSGEFNIPNYTLSGLGGVPSTRELTINGTTYDLSADRSWDVGTVTSIGTSGPLTGGTITDSGTIGITQSGVSSDGYLSSTDWNTFNNKQDALTNPVTGTGTTYYLPMWTGATTLSDSIISIGLGVVNFNYNNAEGATVNYINTATTTYTYSISMNNVTRATFHSYTDGIIVNSIGANQVSRVFANGNMILGDGTSDTGYKLSVEGNLYIETIINATTDTDKFIVSDSGVIKYRTGSEVLSDIGAVPATRQLTINGTSYDLSADRSWSVGTVTSVDMSVPTGFAISGNPVTGSGTLALVFAAGYSLPTNISQGEWDTAYDRSLTSAAVTGTTTKTLTLNQQDGGTITASWTDFDTAPVTSVFGRTGAIIAQSGDYTTTLVTEGTNLYFTDSRARSAISLTTLGTSGPATYSNVTGILNIPDYGSVLTGYVPYTGATQDLDLGTYGLLSDFVRFNLSSSNIPSAAGVMWWDNIEGTVRLSLKGNTYNLPIGESVVARVRNSTGGNLSRTAYQAVRVAGAQGQRLAVALAQANNDPNSASTLGLVCEDISTNQEGFIVNIGQIVNVNTTGSLQGETWLDGNVLYLSPTIPGALTNIKPTAPQHTVIIGYVEYAHANNGKIYVKVDNGYELEELHDVAPTPYVNNGVLYRDTATNLWKSATIATLLGYTPANQAITLTINGTGYDLSANRTWNVGTVTSVDMSVPTGFSIGGNPITGSGTLALAFASGYSLPTTASQTNWDTAYNNRITSLTTTGTGGAATLTSHVLNIPVYQTQGNYITSLTGEATASGPGAASVTLSNSAVTGKILTGLSVVNTAIVSTDTILTAFGKLQGQVNGLVGGLQYQGTWNAATNTPTITSGVGTDGHFYIVSVAGTTNIDGINDWQVGDWIVFHDTAWQKVDNTDSVTSVNGFTGAVSLTTSNIGEGTNLYFTNSRARQAINLTTTGSSGVSTYNNVTGVLNVPEYTLSGLGGVPTSRTLTINGTALDLSANRSWSVGTVTSIATSGPITGGTITGTGTIGITQASASTNGYLSSTDWNTFNNKQNTFSGTINYLAKFTAASNIGDSLLFDSGSAIGLGTATINAAALFQMDSTTRGFLPPRMTQAQRQAIATTPEGLIVYQTNGVIGLYIYANGTWRTLGMI